MVILYTLLVIIPVALVLWVLVCFSSVVQAKQLAQVTGGQITEILDRKNEVLGRLQFIRGKVEPPEKFPVQQWEVLQEILAEDTAAGTQDLQRRASFQQRIHPQAEQIIAALNAHEPMREEENFIILQQLLSDRKDQLRSLLDTYNKAASAHNRLIYTSPNHFLAQKLKYAQIPLLEIPV